MESSSGMTVRALVTLAFLILVPLAAVFGTRFTGGVSAAKQAPPPTNNADAKSGRVATSPPKQPAGENSARPVPVQARQAVASNFVAGAKPDAAPRVAQAPSNPPNLPASAPPGPPTAGAKAAMWNSGPGDAVRPGVNQSQPAGPQNPAQTAPPAASSGPIGDAATTDPFTWMQRRLKELGAIYYRLENGGPKGEMFRFQCQMAVPGNPNGVQPFEAIEGDPLKAMQRVLQQVEVWHSKLVR
jgi:hypothetical protein